MKRVLAVLVLTVAGLLTSSILMAPDTALAGEPDVLGLEVPDSREGTLLDTLAKPDDDNGGDPDSLTGGFGMDDALDEIHGLDAGTIPDGITTWEDLFIYLATTYWLI